MTDTTYDLVIVRATLHLPVPEGVTGWRFVTVREGDKVSVGRIEPVQTHADDRQAELP